MVPRMMAPTQVYAIHSGPGPRTALIRSSLLPCLPGTSGSGFRGHHTARRVMRRGCEKPGVVQGFKPAHRERMRLGKLGYDRPEPPELACLLQELIDVHFLVDVASGGEQHQSLFASRRQERAVPVAGELPGSREEPPQQGNPIDV